MHKLLNILKHKFSKENILRVLILFTILAIVYSLYSQYLVPYLEEIKVRKQDEVRINDINKLDEALKATFSTTTAQNLASSTVYISIPSDSPTCEDLNLPKLPTDWKYNCVTRENLTNVDGTGWIPVNLSNKFSELPVDPYNSPKNDLQYRFVWEVENQKYALMTKITSKVSNNLNNKIPNTRTFTSKNSEFSIALKSVNILTYLPLEYDNDDSVILDYTKPNTPIDLPQGGLYSTEKCKLKTCLSNTTENSSTITLPPVLDNKYINSLSYSLFFKMRNTPKSNFQLFNPGLGRLDTNFEGQSGSLFIWFESDEPKGYLVYKSTPKKFTDNRWHKLFVTKQGPEIKVFVDGIRVGKFTAPKAEPAKILKNSFIDIAPGLSLNEITIYGRSYSDLEIEQFYGESF